MRKKGYKGRCEKKNLSKSMDVCRSYDAIQQEKEVLLASNQDLRMENARLESRKDRLRMDNHDLKQKQLQFMENKNIYAIIV